MRIGQSAGKSYAYILGVYLGDGCITKSHDGYDVFRLNTIDRDFAETVKYSLKDLTDNAVNICTHSIKKSSKPNHALQCMCQDLCKRLNRQTERKANIPKWVFRARKDIKLAFIAGLMDSEGFVAANKSNPTNRRFYMGYKSCDPWVPEFLDILHSVGIRTGKVSKEKPRKDGYKTPTRFHIKMQSWIDSGAYFNIRRKQDRVDQWASAGAYENRSWRPRRLSSETNMPDTPR